MEYRTMDEALTDLGRTRYCSDGKLVLIIHGLNTQRAVPSWNRTSSPVCFPHTTTIISTNLLKIARDFVSSHGTVVTFDPESPCHQTLWPSYLDMDDFAQLPPCWQAMPAVVEHLSHLSGSGVMTASMCCARLQSLISSPAEAQTRSTQTALRWGKRHFTGKKVLASEIALQHDDEAHQTYLVIVACMERAWLRLLSEVEVECPEALHLLEAMADTDRTNFDSQWLSAAGSVSALRYLEDRCLIWQDHDLIDSGTWHYSAAINLATKIWLTND